MNEIAIKLTREREIHRVRTVLGRAGVWAWFRNEKLGRLAKVWKTERAGGRTSEQKSISFLLCESRRAYTPICARTQFINEEFSIEYLLESEENFPLWCLGSGCACDLFFFDDLFVTDLSVIGLFGLLTSLPVDDEADGKDGANECGVLRSEPKFIRHVHFDFHRSLSSLVEETSRLEYVRSSSKGSMGDSYRPPKSILGFTASGAPKKDERSEPPAPALSLCLGDWLIKSTTDFDRKSLLMAIGLTSVFVDGGSISPAMKGVVNDVFGLLLGGTAVFAWV